MGTTPLGLCLWYLPHLHQALWSRVDDCVRDKLRGRVGLSAWKSSPKTEKRLRLDWTKTAQDWKFPGPSKTATVVWSSVSHNFRNLKTDKRLVFTYRNSEPNTNTNTLFPPPSPSPSPPFVTTASHCECPPWAKQHLGPHIDHHLTCWRLSNNTHMAMACHILHDDPPTAAASPHCLWLPLPTTVINCPHPPWHTRTPTTTATMSACPWWHMEEMTWHLNGPLQMCHIVQTAVMHAVIAIHSRVSDYITS